MNKQNWQKTLHSESKTIASIYNQRAIYYDVLVHTLSLGLDLHYRHIAVERLRLKKGDRVLDLGCGTGLDLPLLSQKVGPKGLVAGLDLSQGMLYRAYQRVHRHEYINISTVLGNSLELPFKDKSFDAVFCDYLLSTVPAVNVIEEAFRVAKPDARMVFADDRLPSGWFASPIKAIVEFLRTGYFNCALPGIELLRSRLSSVTITHHHGGLIFILSGQVSALRADFKMGHRHSRSGFQPL